LRAAAFRGQDIRNLDYFGEVALITEQDRLADVYAEPTSSPTRYGGISS
jgi:hypothetical protein